MTQGLEQELASIAQTVHETVMRKIEDEGIGSRAALGSMWVDPLMDDGLVLEVSWKGLDIRGKSGFLLDGWSIREGDDGRNSRRVHLFAVYEQGTSVDGSQLQYAATVAKSVLDSMFTRMDNLAFALKHGDVLDQEIEDEDVAAMAVALRSALSASDLELELVILTDGRASSRSFGHSAKSGALQRVLDIAWFQKNSAEDEDYRIDFRGLDCLVAERADDGSPKIMLTVLKGDVLAQIYAQHRERLMERNLRSYLQQNNKVNKGIARTIRESPEKFLAYNNGISATATSVEFDDAGRLTFVGGLQIVNGGQTTATIHSLWMKPSTRENVQRLSVQAKLTVVDDVEASVVVPMISICSNSQTAIKGSDLTANVDWEVEMERASRNIAVRGVDGNDTYWYYERTRGAYATMLAVQPTAAARARKEREWPKHQVLTKADAALLLASWDGHPDLASQGSEKGFIAITKNQTGLGKGMSELPEDPELRKAAMVELIQSSFRRVVALAMLRAEIKRVVAETSNKMKPAVVNYTLAWIGDRANKTSRGGAFDFDPAAVCRTGKLPSRLLAILRDLVVRVDDVIQNQRPSSVVHEGEWPKKPSCWTSVQGLNLTDPLPAPSRPGGVRPGLQLEPGKPATSVQILAAMPLEEWRAASLWVTRITNVSERTRFRSRIEKVYKSLQNGKGVDEEFACQALQLIEEARQKGFKYRPFDSR